MVEGLTANFECGVLDCLDLLEDEYLRYGSPTTEGLPFARLTRQEKWAYRVVHAALGEVESACGKMTNRGVVKWGLARSLFEVICRDTLDLELEPVLEYCGTPGTAFSTLYSLGDLDECVTKNDVRIWVMLREKRAQYVATAKENARLGGNCSHWETLFLCF